MAGRRTVTWGFDCVREWVDGESEALAGMGVRAERVVGPAERDKKAAWVDLESDTRLARVIFWDSGEVDLTVLDVARGAAVCEEHREVTSRQEVVNTLQDAAAWTAS